MNYSRKIQVFAFNIILFFIFFYTSSGQGTFTLSPDELIFNGDFSLGNTGFFTDYIYEPYDLSPEGNYTITYDPNVNFNELSDCHDHTTGKGLMLVANGSFFPNEAVWGQEIQGIIPNTDYLFSVWLGMAIPSNPASIAIYINNVLLDTNIFQLPHDVCIWHNYQYIWTSGNNSSATITIIDTSLESYGNDFMVDDISFKQITSLQVGSDRSGSLSLMQNHPNPASGQTEIDLSLLDDNAELFLVNILGVKVSELGKFEHSGEHKITFDVSDLSPGIYFYILQTPTQILTKRMEIMR